MKQKFGKSDPDMGSRFGGRRKTKEIADRPMKGPGSDPKTSAMIGGVANKPGNPSMKKNR